MAVNSGTVSGVNSTTAVIIASRPCRKVTVHNDDGSIIVKLGNASAQNFTLGPGQSTTLYVVNANQVYVKSVSGSPVVTYLTS
jgi:hypothetical protein